MKSISIVKNSGVVLPAVLWITILTIVIAGNYASAVHVNTKGVDNIKAAMFLKYDSTSGVYIALGRLLSDRSTDNVQYSLQLNDSRLDIDVRPEGLKTSLNTAGSYELRKTFISAGADPDTAEILSARIIDWRDQDHSVQPNGMEDIEYYNSGKEYGAKDKRFEDLIELLLIADLDENLFNRISDYFTVYGGGIGQLFTITSRASNLKGNKSYVIKVIAQLTYHSERPYRILKWRYNQS